MQSLYRLTVSGLLMLSSALIGAVPASANSVASGTYSAGSATAIAGLPMRSEADQPRSARELTTNTTATYTALGAPQRILETRPGRVTADGQFAGIGLRSAGSTLRLSVAGRVGIPTNAAAVAVNVTAVGAPAGGFATVFPCGVSRPSTSTLNFQPGQAVANAAIVKVGTGGDICLFVNRATHLLVDVSGFFPPDTYVGLDRPLRFVETRPGRTTDDGQLQGGGIRPAGSTLAFDVAGRSGVPADATSIVMNVTATGAITNGFATVFPCGVSRPNASNLNYVPGQSKANMVVTKVGANGRVCLFTNQPAHFIVDVSGVIPDNVFTPLPAPRRLLETRAGQTTADGQFQGIGIRGSETSTRVRIAGRAGLPSNVSAVVLNVTATQAAIGGFATVYPKGVARPNASNVNYPVGQSVPNAVVAKVGVNGDICLYAHRSAHFIIDVAGYLEGPAPASSGSGCTGTAPPTQPPTEPEPPTEPTPDCDPSYPTVCIPPPPPDLDCGDIPYRDFVVLQPDPHGFDGNQDGIGCVS